MTRTMTTLLAAMLMTGAASARAEDTHYAVETDPTTLLFDGYAFHLRMSPNRMSPLRFGAGIYSMEFPDAIVDLNPNNRDQGWQVDLHRGYGLFLEYYQTPGQEGWLLGAQTALHQFRISNVSETGHQEFRNILLMPYAGYRWVHNSGFYIQPWAGAGYTRKIDGDTRLGNQEYDIAPLMMFATVHVGYEFGRGPQ